MNTTSPTLRGDTLAAFEKLDAEIRTWALSHGSAEESYPVLMDAATLGRAGYPDAFPHLLMARQWPPIPRSRSPRRMSR